MHGAAGPVRHRMERVVFVMTTAADFFAACPELANYAPPLTSDQEVALDLVCSDREDALPRLQEWLAAVDVRDLDDGVNRLFPFLSERLSELDPKHPLLPFFRGNCRKTFYTNNLLFRRAAQKFAALQAKGIPVLILKGAALIDSHAYRVGLRPMADIDFLIPTEDVGRALEILTSLTFDRLAVESLRDFKHGHTIYDDLGFQYDLHWHVLPQCCGHAGRNAPFWQVAEATSFHGVEVLCLRPTDSLFLVCVHGIQWNPVPPIRWIPDSLALLEKGRDQIEWSRLVRQAAETETTLLVTLALRYLRTRFQAPIPEQVFTDLGHNTVSDLEAASLPLALVPWGHRVPWTQAEPVLREQVRLHAARDPTRPILVLLPWESWTPEQTRVCESIGAVPIVRANGLPAAWQSTVQGYFEQHATAWTSTLRAHYARNPRESITFAVRLVGPDHGAWRVVFRTTPPATGDIQQWSPHLEVVEIDNSPLEAIARDAIQIEGGRFTVMRPGTTALTSAEGVLAHYNQQIATAALRASRA